VAVGEIGLDYFVPGWTRAAERFYRAQLQLARRFDLPVILHVRRSADQLLKGLREVKVRGGIAHAFNGSLQQAQAFIALGFKLGFGGAVTYDRALQLRRLAAELPAGPWCWKPTRPTFPRTGSTPPLPSAAQGQPQGRNAPAELPRIAQVVADLRGMPWRPGAQPPPPMPVALPRLAGLLQKLLIKMACSAYGSSASSY
jgi:TatD DNase family protein